jgi:hypothetical protein
MSRTSVLLATLTLLAVGGYLRLGGGEDGTQRAGDIILRVAIVLAAIWLAMPQLEMIFKRGYGQYGILLGLGAIALCFAKGAKVIVPVVAVSILVMAGLQYVQQFFGGDSGGQSGPKKTRRR